MLLNFRVYILILAMGALINVASAQEQPDLDVLVRNEAFCIDKSSLDCQEFLVDQDRIQISRLPRNDNGERIIYFHSVQTIKSGSTFVHTWETRDAIDQRPRAKLYQSDSARNIARSLLDTLTNYLERLEVAGFAVVMRNGAVDSPRYRAYSNRVIHGPGEFTAYVTNINGEIISGSEKRTITIIE